jgi:hypothetical protein
VFTLPPIGDVCGESRLDGRETTALGYSGTSAEMLGTAEALSKALSVREVQTEQPQVMCSSCADAHIAFHLFELSDDDATCSGNETLRIAESFHDLTCLS